MFNLNDKFSFFDEPIDLFKDDEIDLYFEKKRINYKNSPLFSCIPESCDDLYIHNYQGFIFETGHIIGNTTNTFFWTTINFDAYRRYKILLKENSLIVIMIVYYDENTKNWFFYNLFDVAILPAYNMNFIHDFRNSPTFINDVDIHNGNVNGYNLGDTIIVDIKTIDNYVESLIKKYPQINPKNLYPGLYLGGMVDLRFYLTKFTKFEIKRNFNNEKDEFKELIKRDFKNNNNAFKELIKRDFKNNTNYAFERIAFIQIPPKRVIIRDFDE